jgi:hypothetical protein
VSTRPPIPRVALACALALAAVAAGGASPQAPPAPAASAPVSFDRYHTPPEIVAAVQAYAKAHPGQATVHTIAKSPAGLDVVALEIGPDVAAKTRTAPAVLVVANEEGTVPLASEAALALANLLFSKPEATKALTWYIVPALNPDAARRFFAKPLVADARNGSSLNDDRDDQADEDGPDDLNGDGVISQMRVKDPAGEWMPVEGDARLMKKADAAKGEQGVYTLYTEGLDNDGDGAYNEDPAGGVNIGVTFPHLFHPFAPEAGPWSGHEPETYGLLQFAVAHPEIAMAVTFGSTNFCLNPPRGGRRGSADFTAIKVPEEIAKRFGADPNRTYSMQEIIDMVQPMVPPGFEINESMIASFLGLGAVVNPLDDDLKFYRELSDQYKAFLKTAKLDGKRLDPAPAKDGSFELWAYYHLGLPSFSMDFWTLPVADEPKAEPSGITADTLEGLSNDAFLALGEDKLAAFLKEVGAPPNVSAKMLMDGVKSGRMTPKQMAGMLRQMPKPKDASGADPKTKALVAFSDKTLGGKGYLAWTSFTHPTLGEVEIGGAVPFADTTPPASMIAPLVDGQVPWVLQLAGKLPHLHILKTEVAARGAGVYALTVWIENSGYLPFPTAMGKRDMHVPPAIVTVKGAGVTRLSGLERTPLKAVGGHAAVKLEWLLQADKPGTVDVTLASPTAWGDAATARLGGAQ